ncbi:MAG: hypothetical protein IT495_22625 [Gammaproteobacteria bacterium]|nr:hypothetical protein [Gammaproteobacteria bacterium]
MRRLQLRGDGSAATFAVISATLIIAHQVAGKATRDGLFLAYFDVVHLPKIVVATALTSIAGVLAMSRLLAVFGPARLVPRAFAMSAGLFGVEWVVFAFDPRYAAVLLYVHMGVFGALLISGFWSVVNERFDPHTAKRTVARIAAAATLGGLVGGVIAERVSELVDVRAMLPVLAGMHLACAATVVRIGTRSRGMTSSAAIEPRPGLRVLAGSRYLLTMATLMIVVAVTAALLDYALKSEAARRFPTSESLVGFFASFYAVVGIVTFAVQSLFGGAALQRFGLAGAMTVLPLTVLAGSAVAAAVPRLVTVAALRGVEAVFANSFFRAGFELLYTPVSPSDKRPTKTIIDVASNRLGDLIGGGLLLALVAVIPALPTRAVLVGAAIFAVVGLAVVHRLHRGYVGQLATSLGAGTVSVDTIEAIDATTRRFLAEWSPQAEREMLQARINHRRSAGHAAAVPEGPGTPLPATADIRARLVAELRSGDVERIRAALHSEHLERSSTPHLVELLAHPQLADEARLELRWLVPRVIGQLTDALLDPDTPVVVRQRLPSVMEVCHNPRTVEGLLQGLEDSVFHVRYSCARALGRMLSRSDDLSVGRERIFAAVLRELEVDDQTWREQGRVPPSDFDEAATAPSGVVDLSLQHVFTLLGLTLDPDAMHLAMHAVTSRDRGLRGTAIEYLENVLPAEVREGLWRLIGIREGSRPSGRSSREMLRDLERIASGRQA